MKAVIVDRQLSSDELAQVRSFDGTVFTTDQVYAADKGATVLSLSEEDSAKFVDKVWHHILDFPNSKVGSEFMAKISHENFYMWYCLRFRMYNQLKHDFLLYHTLKPALDESSSITLYSNADDAWQLFYDGSAAIETIKADQQNSGSSKQAKKAFMKRFVKRALGQAFKGSGFSKPKHIVLANNRHYQPMVDLRSLQSRKGNPYLEYLFDVAGDDICVLEYPIFPAQNDSIEAVNNVRTFDYGGDASVYRQDWIMIRGMMNPGFWIKYRNLKKQWNADLNAIKASCTDAMDQNILHRMQQWRSIGFLCLIYFITTSSWVKRKRKKILSVSAIGESNSEIRSMFEAFKRYDIPTVGIMHGAVHAANIHYSYAKEELKYKPFPDYYFVWGDFWKDQIQEFTGIAANRLIPTGQIRTDVIPKLLDKAKNNKSDRLSVVFASQPFRDMNMRVQAAKLVFAAIAKLPGDQIEFILKPHPAETSDAFFTEIADRVGLKGMIISRDRDLYEQLAECDVLMTCYSTVGAEAVYFGKAVITIDAEGRDLAGYAQEAIATAVRNSAELTAVLQQMLDNGVQVDLDAHARFITKYVHKINGRASERTLEALRAIENKQ